MPDDGSTQTVKLRTATLKCLLCHSTLMLKGQYAQRVAESGTCPVCSTHGLLMMDKFTV